MHNHPQQHPSAQAAYDGALAGSAALDEAAPDFPASRMQGARAGDDRPLALGDVLARGLLAGAAGVAAMTLAEKLEQAITGRPNSYVPGHTLERILGLPQRPDRERRLMNWAMHWGQGMALGMVRALMARQGLRGPAGSFLHLNLRLINDQTLENATGVGAPPWTWPVDEQVIDLLHKAIYAYATGAAADRLVGGPDDRSPVKGGHYYEQTRAHHSPSDHR